MPNWIMSISKLKSRSTTRTPMPARNLKLSKLNFSTSLSPKADTVSSLLTTLAAAPITETEEEEGSRRLEPFVAALFCRVKKDMVMEMLALK